MVVKSKNSLALLGALTNHLQCCNLVKENFSTSGSQNGRQGLKGKLIFDFGIPSKRNKQQRRKKDTMKTIMEIVTAKVFARQLPNKNQLQGCCQKGKVHDIQ